MENLSLADEIRVAERRYKAQMASVSMDEAFLKDVKACEAMPQVAAAVRERLKRNRKAFEATTALRDELLKAAGAGPQVDAFKGKK